MKNQTRLRFAACYTFSLLALALVATGCNETTLDQATASPSIGKASQESSPTTEAAGGKKVGVLLVSHGSHSKQWREMLLAIETSVQEEVASEGSVAGMKSAFMEYTEPSIATRLKEFDAEQYTDVIIVPLLLTVSSHSFDDIPVIAGQKEDRQTIDTLKLEGIAIYKPKAAITLAPLLDFPNVLGKNIARRAKELSTNPQGEGLVLVAYGSEPYDEEWKELLDDVGEKVRKETGINFSEYCWCGHIAHYSSKPTEEAIQKVLKNKKRALVVPVLVAVDEAFQGKIIGGAIKNVDQGERVLYRHDSILPDSNINQWVVEISHQLAKEIQTQATKGKSTAAGK